MGNTYTLDTIQLLMDEYISILNKLDGEDETVYKQQLAKVKEELLFRFNQLRNSDPLLFPFNFDDYLAEETAQSFKESLRQAANNRYSQPTLPLGSFLTDNIQGENIHTPSLIPWQDENNPKQNFVINYNATNTTAAVSTLNNLLLNILLSFSPKNININIFDFDMTGLANMFTVGLDPQFYHDSIIINSEDANKCIKRLSEQMATVMSKHGNALKANNLAEKIVVPYEIVLLNNYPNRYDGIMERLMPLFEHGYKCGIYFIVLNNKDTCLRDANQPHILQKDCYQLLSPTIRTCSPKGLVSYTSFVSHSQIQQLCFDYLNETRNKKEKRTVLKQSYETASNTPYQTDITEISVTVGNDIVSNQPIEFKLNSKDHIHAFILGQSGSGKSVLLNNIISTAIIKYAPEDLLLYLMDFKGVEFNRYRNVKHVKAVLVDNSDPQMTLEVLRELKEENKKRVKLWQQRGVSDIDNYNKQHPDNRMPQILFVADECQVMFGRVNAGGLSMSIQREISDILNIIATQGRSQGIHMLLATQQLDGSDISGQVLTNLTECFLLMCAPADANKLVPDSGEVTSIQPVGQASYYHKKELKSQVQTYYANEEELATAIQKAQEKSLQCKSNGEAYFCGSQTIAFIQEERKVAEKRALEESVPTAYIGRNIGIHQLPTFVELHNDFAENVLVFGANAEEQAMGVALNAMVSTMMTYQSIGKYCECIVLDCIDKKNNSKYYPFLAELSNKGLCKVIGRSDSGVFMQNLCGSIRRKENSETLLVILGQEKFQEIRRNLPFDTKSNADTGTIQGIEELSYSVSLDISGNSDAGVTTYKQALTYILDEGPFNGVHVIMQVDKPSNIMFDGDYDLTAVEKMKHIVMLKSENKFIQPLRISTDIDVEALNDDEDHLRAYYYRDGDAPQLFTPFQFPNLDNIFKR